MRITSFNRFEFKYLLTRSQYQRVVDDLSAYMSLDSHGCGQQGYPITSLYYDTAGYQAYWDKLEGQRLRRKLRIRVYGSQEVSPDTPCFAEIKQHVSKTISKKRVRLPYATAASLCGGQGGISGSSAADQAAIEEIEVMALMLQLRPACITSYHRLAFNGSDYEPGLRVTFDTNLKCRGHDLTLLSPGDSNRYFLSPDLCIMEVKVNYRVPPWLSVLIGRHGCTRRRISKYCAALETSRLALQNQRFEC